MNQLISFLSKEALNLAVGYLAGLIASNLVSRFFVKRGLVNLWGLTANRNALKGEEHEWLMFGASYLIGLIVIHDPGAVPHAALARPEDGAGRNGSGLRQRGAGAFIPRNLQQPGI